MQHSSEFYVIKHNRNYILRYEGYKSPAKKEESQLCREQQMFVRLSIDIPSMLLRYSLDNPPIERNVFTRVMSNRKIKRQAIQCT